MVEQRKTGVGLICSQDQYQKPLILLPINPVNILFKETETLEKDVKYPDFVGVKHSDYNRCRSGILIVNFERFQTFS